MQYKANPTFTQLEVPSDELKLNLTQVSLFLGGGVTFSGLVRGISSLFTPSIGTKFEETEVLQSEKKPSVESILLALKTQ